MSGEKNKLGLQGDIIHLTVCIERLGSCQLTVQDVKANLDHPLAGPAFRYAVVEYMTLFNQSLDAQRHARRICLEWIPEIHLALHERLAKTRNKLLAHADMSVLDGSLDFNEARGLRVVTTLTHVDDLAELKNVDGFLELIQALRDRLFEERRTLLAALPSTQQ